MLSSCDLSQIPGLDGKLSIEDSKAVGAACRHSGRALEDCFALNPKTHPAGVFEGWRDMNDYMLANEIEVVKPEIKTSAFSAPAAGGHAAAPAAVAPGVLTPQSNPAASAAAPVEPATGRQRWLPKDARPEQGEAAAAQPQAVPEPAHAAPPAVAEEPAKPESPSRPWERKKDPKKHT